MKKNLHVAKICFVLVTHSLLYISNNVVNYFFCEYPTEIAMITGGWGCQVVTSCSSTESRHMVITISGENPGAILDNFVLAGKGH